MSETTPMVTRPTTLRGGGVRRVGYVLGVWVLLAVVGVANGVVRGLVLEPVLGAYPGHVVSTLVTGIPAFLLVAYLAFGRRAVTYTRRELAGIGGLWVVLTVAFEFGFGHYVMGHPWSRLLADYDLLAGRLWGLVLVALLVAPLLFGHYLKRS